MVQLIRSAFQQFLQQSKISIFPASGLVVVAAWIVVCLVSRNPDTDTLPVFLACALIITVCSGLVVWKKHLSGQRIAFKWILLTALLLRLISLVGEPLFEDDYYRYMWDGYQTATTQDPYTVAPGYYFDQDVPEIFEPVLSLINYPDVATVYGPVTQWVFAIGYYISAAEVWPLQLMALIADLLVLCLLYKLGAGNALLLYAWSPLILKEFSLTAHPDIYAILLMLISVFFAYKRLAVLAGITIGLAFGSKVFAILVIPYLVTSGWLLKQWVTFSAALITTLAGITFWYGSIGIWVPDGLQAMADDWLFNAPLYTLLLNRLEFTFIKLMLASLFIVFVLCAFCRRLFYRPFSKYQLSDKTTSDTSWQSSAGAFRGDWLYALFLLSIPALNAWYVTWILPFAVLYPRWWSWTASYAVLLSYWWGGYIGATGFDSQRVSPTVMAIEYSIAIIIPLLAMMLNWYQLKRREGTVA